jgi:hypothetical protein
MSDTSKPFFTLTSAYSLAAVLFILFLANTGAKLFLPKTAKRVDRLTFIWLVRLDLLTDIRLHVHYTLPRRP